jgi:glyoxylase-like metal-dependent hydrolase (beta-lactamase superfamily II)
VLLYRVFELKPKIFVSVPDDVIDQDCDPQYNRAGVAGFIVTSEGVVVVDTSNSPMSGRDLLYEIRHRTDLPIRDVINTGSAPDHMLGNEVFADELATIISTRAAQVEVEQYKQELERRFHAEDGWRLQDRMRGFHVTPATQTFTDTMSFTLGGKEFRIKSMQSDGGAPEDASVYLPADKILFLGDLFQNQYFPQVGQRDVRKWIQALHNLEMWDIESYVPGHGAPGSKKDLEEFRKFLEWSVAQIEMRLKQGKSPEDIVRDLRIVQTYRWHAPERAQDFVLDICRQLAPPGPAPANPPAP